jgi:hypothetical protein
MVRCVSRPSWEWPPAIGNALAGPSKAEEADWRTGRPSALLSAGAGHRRAWDGFGFCGLGFWVLRLASAPISKPACTSDDPRVSRRSI